LRIVHSPDRIWIELPRGRIAFPFEADISLSTNEEFISLIERSRARHEKEGGISSEEMRRRFAAAQDASDGAE
jgi:hypothetical protein